MPEAPDAAKPSDDREGKHEADSGEKNQSTSGIGPGSNEQRPSEQPPTVTVIPVGTASTPTDTVSPSSAVDVKDLAKLDAVRQAGMHLAIGVGSLIALITILLVIHWMVTAPWTGIPRGLSEMKTADAKAAVENIKTLNDFAAGRSIKLFDAIVSRALLPVFTAILGYIFGSRTESK